MAYLQSPEMHACDIKENDYEKLLSILIIGLNVCESIRCIVLSLELVRILLLSHVMSNESTVLLCSFFKSYINSPSILQNFTDPSICPETSVLSSNPRASDLNELSDVTDYMHYSFTISQNFNVLSIEADIKIGYLTLCITLYTESINMSTSVPIEYYLCFVILQIIIFDSIV